VCDSVSGPEAGQLCVKWTSGTVLPRCRVSKTTTSRGREGPNTIESTPPRGRGGVGRERKKSENDVT